MLFRTNCNWSPKIVFIGIIFAQLENLFHVLHTGDVKMKEISHARNKVAILSMLKNWLPTFLNCFCKTLYENSFHIQPQSCTNVIRIRQVVNDHFLKHFEKLWKKSFNYDILELLFWKSAFEAIALFNKNGSIEQFLKHNLLICFIAGYWFHFDKRNLVPFKFFFGLNHNIHKNQFFFAVYWLK